VPPGKTCVFRTGVLLGYLYFLLTGSLQLTGARNFSVALADGGASLALVLLNWFIVLSPRTVAFRSTTLIRTWS
jgi:hypothetical protein